jgi:hypothetical protein
MQCGRLLPEHEDHSHDRLLEHENTVRLLVCLCSWLALPHLPHSSVLFGELLIREERLDQTLHLFQLYHFSALCIEIGDKLPSVKTCWTSKKIEGFDETETLFEKELVSDNSKLTVVIPSCRTPASLVFFREMVYSCSRSSSSY